ncbi:MAG: hypothetical protein HFI49_02610 [Bacilli bacterium]|jgi:hypothetical protein|nr:hypothetical protein [Bacilli bacterium]
MHSVEKKIYLGLLVCLLVSVVGTSFAYFVSSTTIGGEGGKANMSTADMVGVNFDAGDSAINLQNAMPGLGKEKGFAVTLTPTSNTKTITYAVKLNISENTFVKCDDTNYKADEPNSNLCTKDAEELVYTLMDEEGNTLATGDLLGKTESLILKKETKTVDAETVFNYKLNVTYKDTNADQNHNANKSFIGSLSVEFAQAD